MKSRYLCINSENVTIYIPSNVILTRCPLSTETRGGHAAVRRLFRYYSGCFDIFSSFFLLLLVKTSRNRNRASSAFLLCSPANKSRRRRWFVRVNRESAVTTMTTDNNGCLNGAMKLYECCIRPGRLLCRGFRTFFRKTVRRGLLAAAGRSVGIAAVRPGFAI